MAGAGMQVGLGWLGGRLCSYPGKQCGPRVYVRTLCVCVCVCAVGHVSRCGHCCAGARAGKHPVWRVWVHGRLRPHRHHGHQSKIGGCGAAVFLLCWCHGVGHHPCRARAAQKGGGQEEGRHRGSQNTSVCSIVKSMFMSFVRWVSHVAPADTKPSTSCVLWSRPFLS